MKPDEFGIFQLISLPKMHEGSQPETTTAPERTNTWACDPSPLTHHGTPLKLSFWVADEGCFYGPALLNHLQIDLQTAVFAKTRDAKETWAYALEAVQTGLFENLILRASEGCRPAMLRKMQLVAESLRCRIFILCKENLPHWFFRASYPLSSLGEFLQNHETISLPSKPARPTKSPRGLFEFDAESKRLRA
jgi:hypothetical protein